jgi:hypothetical protein
LMRCVYCACLRRTGSIQGKVNVSQYADAAKKDSAVQWHGRENDASSAVQCLM